MRREVHSRENLREPFSKLLAAVEELEQLVNYGSLDIEFAVDVSHRIHILQVRPIVKHSGRTRSFRANEYDLITNNAKDHFINLSNAMPQIPGNPRPLFANMLTGTRGNNRDISQFTCLQHIPIFDYR